MTDDRLTGYATENVVPITALEQDTIDALWDELRASLTLETWASDDPDYRLIRTTDEDRIRNALRECE